MKKIYFLTVVCLLFTLGITNLSKAQTVIFSEDFASVDGTGGNDGLWSGTGVASYTLDAFGEWGLEKVFKGEECVKVGTSNTTTGLGYITTPELTKLSGNAVLTFRAGAWNGTDKTELLLEIEGGGSLGQASVELKKAEFSDYAVQITEGTATTKITFKGQSPPSRFFLDDVVVTTGNMSVEDVNVAKNKVVLSNTLIADQVSVLLDGTSKVEFYSANGSLVKSVTVTANQPINTQDLVKGVYLVRVVNAGRSETVKVIKK
ncbi:MAG: T9SS type A sorting domain-containing protein [Flavobacteriaceae bacterium]|jgi:cytochrome c-type biogenesis protein CcmE|nr:T9SS type A sorting domain-containing protein [Flavobacteriaceae bacterium]